MLRYGHLEVSRDDGANMAPPRSKLRQESVGSGTRCAPPIGRPSYGEDIPPFLPVAVVSGICGRALRQ